MWLSVSHSAFLFFPVPNPFSLVILTDIIISLSLFFLLHNLHRPITFCLKPLIKTFSPNDSFSLKIFSYWQYSVPPKFDQAYSFFCVCQWNRRKRMYSNSLFCLKVNLSDFSSYLSSPLTVVFVICLSNHKERYMQ